jgi:hypothetical protein
VSNKKSTKFISFKKGSKPRKVVKEPMRGESVYRNKPFRNREPEFEDLDSDTINPTPVQQLETEPISDRKRVKKQT